MARKGKRAGIEMRAAMWAARHPASLGAPGAVWASVAQFGPVTTGGCRSRCRGGCARLGAVTPAELPTLRRPTRPGRPAALDRLRRGALVVDRAGV
jgi:hypothetical protein